MWNLENLKNYLLNKWYLENIKKIIVNTELDLFESVDGGIKLLSKFDLVNNYYWIHWRDFIFYLWDFTSFEFKNKIDSENCFDLAYCDYTIKELNEFIIFIINYSKIKCKINY